MRNFARMGDNMKRLNFVGYFILPLLFGGVLSACGPNLNHYRKLNEQLVAQNYEAALEYQRKGKNDYAKRDRLLYYLDEGLLAHYADHYDESNASLLKAERIMADLYTRSVSKEAMSFLINDTANDYRGEDFEAALVNLFLAINYVQLGQLDEALVEARKVDSKLNTFNDQYPAGKKNIYKEDAFIRYLMGILYAASGEVNDAFISFRKAEHIYRKDYKPNYGVSPPATLIEDLLWSAAEMDFQGEYSRFRKMYPEIATSFKEKTSDEALVYFIQYNGKGAEKVERSIFVPMPDKYMVKLAYPEFIRPAYNVTGVQISLTNMGNKKLYQTYSHVMENISAIAEKNLKNRIGRIMAKTVARVTAKYLAAKAAEKKALKDGDKDLAKIIKYTFQTYMIAFEIADIRHWRLLPAEIQVGRARLPPGRYEGTIQLLSRNGNTITSQPVAPFSLAKGETKIVTFRTLK